MTAQLLECRLRKEFGNALASFVSRQRLVADDVAKVSFVTREKAIANLAVSCQAQTIAGLAKSFDTLAMMPTVAGPPST